MEKGTEKDISRLRGERREERGERSEKRDDTIVDIRIRKIHFPFQVVSSPPPHVNIFTLTLSIALSPLSPLSLLSPLLKALIEILNFLK